MFRDSVVRIELDKALEAVLVKAQAGCIRLHARVQLVQGLVRTRQDQSFSIIIRASSDAMKLES